MKKTLGLVVALAALTVAVPARAQQTLFTGVHAHDGFYLQLDLGLGAMSSSAKSNGIEGEFSGGGGQFGLAIGGAVTPSFVIAGSVWGTSVQDPTFKIDGQDLGNADGTLTLSGIGVQLAYYFMPANVYVAVTPSITQLSADDGSSTTETETGFGAKIAVGKEWWVSDNWGLGLNLQAAFASNKDKGTDPPTWKTGWFGVAFSATFN